MKVLWLANVPSPYRVEFFNELGKSCDLTVVFEKKTSEERDKSWGEYSFFNFKGVILSGRSISVDSAFCPAVLKYVRDVSFDIIICSNFTDPTGMLAVEYMKWHKMTYYLECDGGFAKTGKGIKEKIKKHLISGAKGYFSTGKACDEYFITYGAECDKIIRYPFSSIREKDVLTAPITKAEKQAIKRRLHIDEAKVILAVGQFIYRKGFDVLIEAASELPKEVGVYFVGGQPTEQYINKKEKLNLKNVHFIGFKNQQELSEYYKASDVFVLPTREDIWGLVIEEAMAYGLPVVSTTRCAAAGELICNGKNGYLIPPENIEGLQQAISKILFEDELRIQMGNNCLEVASHYTIEKMVAAHMIVFKEFA